MKKLKWKIKILNCEVIKQYIMSIEKIGNYIEYRGDFLNIVKKTFTKKEKQYEQLLFREVLTTSPVVHMLPVDKYGNVYPIKEFRPGPEKEMISFPSGRIDDGETPEQAVAREIEEELGMKMVECTSATPPAYSSAGISDELCYFFFVLVEDLPDSERTHYPDDNEDIEVMKMTDIDFGNILNSSKEENRPICAKTLLLWVLFLLMSKNDEEQ